MKLLFSVGLMITTLELFIPCAGAGELSGEEVSGLIAESSKPASVIDWAGLYLEKSELCTSVDGVDNCAEKFNDCLSVKPTTVGFLVELNSTQAYQNVCSFSLEMKASNRGLIYQSQFGEVIVERNGSYLEISSKGVDPTALGLGVCGAHADIDGLRFSLVNKSNDKSQCRSPK